ncbi:MAG: transglutaminase domain-containing protein [Bacteroidales bacterium]|nr:transglutaminase domain-containing protein [Bacteroidales bacterium]
MRLTTIFLALLLSCGHVCMSQQSDKHILKTQQEISLFFEKYDEIYDVYYDFYKNKQFDKAIHSLKELVTFFDTTAIDSQWVDARIYKEEMTADVYYNLACCYALTAQKKLALETLKKSIRVGYKDYRNMLNDSDFESIREDKKFKSLLEEIKQYDRLVILQKSSAYIKEDIDTLPQFVYQDSEDYRLMNVREFFDLDSVAGDGDEISKILNILHFVHKAIRHDGGNFALCEFDAIDIYNYHKSTGKGVNCRHLAIALNEMYLSMGIPSRYVTCMPYDEKDQDCHVINSVWSSQYQKWIWIDPTFEAYVKDENGNFLSIPEVRERLIDGRPLFLNEDANWNYENKQTKEYYLEGYMAKNLYWFDCVTNYCFNPESRYRYVKNIHVVLTPSAYETPSTYENPSDWAVITHDADYFWQAPTK